MVSIGWLIDKIIRIELPKGLVMPGRPVSNSQEIIVLPVTVQLIGATLIRTFLGYISYTILAWPVSICTVAVLLIFASFNLNFFYLLSYLRYLSFINPKFGQESYHGGIPELMQIFFVLSLAFFIIASAAKWLIKHVFRISFSLNHSDKMRIGLIALTALFAIAIVGTSVNANSSGSRAGWFFLLLFMYVIAIFTLKLYLTFSLFLDTIYTEGSKSAIGR